MIIFFLKKYQIIKILLLEDLTYEVINIFSKINYSFYEPKIFFL